MNTSVLPTPTPELLPCTPGWNRTPTSWERLRLQEESRRLRERYLMDHPAFNALMECSDQDESWVCWLLRPDSAGVTPLMKASMSAGDQYVQIMLRYESPYARDNRGMTALMYAAERSNLEACRMLAPLSPLAARGMHGLDALGLCRSQPCADAILLVMAHMERACIDEMIRDMPVTHTVNDSKRL